MTREELQSAIDAKQMELDSLKEELHKQESGSTYQALKDKLKKEGLLP